MNYWGIVKYTALGILLILLLGFIPTAHAEEVNTTGSYVITNEPVYPFHGPYRITQGQEVYINDTIDISGQGWGTGVAWYGTYGQYEEAQYIRKFTGLKRDVQNFYIDPAIFTDKDGMWYQYYDNQDYQERRGNLEAFFVKGGYRQSTLTYPNGTIVNQSVGIHGAVIEKELPPEVILPEVRVSDYLVAIGDPLVTNFTKIWIFGRTNGIYNHDGILSIPEVQGLSVGDYKLISHTPGMNTIYEVGYSDNKFTSPWKGVDDESVYGSQPMLDLIKFNQMVGKTDDKIQTYNMVVEEPSVSIVSIDEVAVGNRIPIAYQPGMTLLDVRGYSNVQNGTVLTFVIDPDKQNAREIKSATFTTTAIRTFPGDMSYYRIYIPINKNQMPNGMHTIKATTPIGGSMLYDFPVSELPPDSFVTNATIVPNATIKYIGDRNPWVPNMTIPDPIIVVQTQIIERVVTVEITPSPELIYEQQQKAQKERVDYWLTVGMVTICSITFLVLLGWYIVLIIRRL